MSNFVYFLNNDSWIIRYKTHTFQFSIISSINIYYRFYRYFDVLISYNIYYWFLSINPPPPRYFCRHKVENFEKKKLIHTKIF